LGERRKEEVGGGGGGGGEEEEEAEGRRMGREGAVSDPEVAFYLFLFFLVFFLFFSCFFSCFFFPFLLLAGTGTARSRLSPSTRNVLAWPGRRLSGPRLLPVPRRQHEHMVVIKFCLIIAQKRTNENGDIFQGKKTPKECVFVRGDGGVFKGCCVENRELLCR
jgi:hypothetical protein